MTSVKAQFRLLNPYDLHKRLINDYVLNKPGATKFLQRNTERDKRDIDVIRENHKFLWDEDQVPLTWEERLAKKYYDKLFKEYCICDLSRYKEDAVAMRWRTENEVVLGRGQFGCGNKKCPLFTNTSNDSPLRTWEVNFAYMEHGEKKNALIKIRLCEDCSVKLNYKTKKREIKRLKSRRHRKDRNSSSPVRSNNEENSKETPSTCHESKEEEAPEAMSTDIWKQPREEQLEKSRGDEFEEFLEELLL